MKSYSETRALAFTRNRILNFSLLHVLPLLLISRAVPSHAEPPLFPSSSSPLSPSSFSAGFPDLPQLAGRQTVTGDGYGGAGFTVLPVLRDEEPATVVLVHGMGGTGEEWGYVSLALSFFALNYVKFIIPSAPVRRVTYLGRRLPSWYDVAYIRDYSAPVNDTQMRWSVNRVNRIVRGEINAGVSANRIFLVGFSQGGGLVLTAFLQSPFDLAGCIGVATWLPSQEDYPSKLNTATTANKQILMMHGTKDDAVPISLAVQSVRRINAFGKPYNLTATLTRFPDHGHLLVTPAVMSAIETYVSTRAPGTTRFLIKLVSDLTDTFSDINDRMSNYVHALLDSPSN